MSAQDNAQRNIHLCNCNGTMLLDAAVLERALELAGPLPIHTQLCQKELAAFADRASGDVLVACTQEARLFGDVADDAGKAQTIRFVNIRESAGWSREAASAIPKIAALIAAAALPDPQPVPRVSFKSGGQLLIIGPAAAALSWAERLRTHLAVTVLVTGRATGAEVLVLPPSVGGVKDVPDPPVAHLVGPKTTFSASPSFALDTDSTLPTTARIALIV